MCLTEGRLFVAQLFLNATNCRNFNMLEPCRSCRSLCAWRPSLFPCFFPDSLLAKKRFISRRVSSVIQEIVKGWPPAMDALLHVCRQEVVLHGCLSPFDRWEDGAPTVRTRVAGALDPTFDRRPWSKGIFDHASVRVSNTKYAARQTIRFQNKTSRFHNKLSVFGNCQVGC